MGSLLLLQQTKAPSQLQTAGTSYYWLCAPQSHRPKIKVSAGLRCLQESSWSLSLDQARSIFYLSCAALSLSQGCLY